MFISITVLLSRVILIKMHPKERSVKYMEARTIITNLFILQLLFKCIVRRDESVFRGCSTFGHTHNGRCERNWTVGYLWADSMGICASNGWRRGRRVINRNDENYFRNLKSNGIHFEMFILSTRIVRWGHSCYQWWLLRIITSMTFSPFLLAELQVFRLVYRFIRCQIWRTSL